MITLPLAPLPVSSSTTVPSTAASSTAASSTAVSSGTVSPASSTAPGKPVPAPLPPRARAGTLPPALASGTPATPVKTAIDSVFEKLLADIVGGTYETGMRLPAERDLAKQLGASRPTLREALRRLGEWNLIKPRRGSGISVQDVNDWMIDVLPSYLRYAQADPDSPSRREMVNDMLQLRRSLMTQIIGMIDTRIPGEALEEARANVQKAWELRQAKSEFASADLDVMHKLVSSAKFLPGLWMLNQMSTIYDDLVASLGAALAPSEGYVAAWNAVLDSLAEGQREQAIEKLDRYLSSHDERLLALLELLP